MSGINPFLAELYGNPNGGQEKTAAALTETDLEVWSAFSKLAEADGFDVNELDDDQIDTLYNHYAGDDDDDYGAEASQEQEVEFPPNWDEQDVEHFSSLDEDGREQFAQLKEAEFLGEVIAHSQFATLRKLANAEMEKEAASMAGFRQGVSDFASKAHGKVKDFGGAIHGQTGGSSKRIAKLEEALKGTRGDERRAIRAAIKSAKNPSEGRKAGLGYGAGALGAGLATGAAVIPSTIAHGRKKKRDSMSKEAQVALEDLATQRALEFLKMAGVIEDEDDDGDDDVDAESMINDRAAEMLIENGYGELLGE